MSPMTTCEMQSEGLSTSEMVAMEKSLPSLGFEYPSDALQLFIFTIIDYTVHSVILFQSIT